MIRIAAVLLLASGLIGVALRPSPAEEPKSLNSGGVSPSLGLKEQLEKGLRARRPVEFDYIAQIVKLVEQGKLPRSLVDSTFGYARKKKDKPLQHFQFTLYTRARSHGIDTPKLDNQVVILR